MNIKATILLSTFLSLFISYAHSVPIITNGSLTGPISNGGVPSGWSPVASTSPDTNDIFSNVGFIGNYTFQATPSASLDGGTWVGLASTDSILESFEQLVSGFTIGTSYDIAWYHANFGHGFGFNQANAIEVLIDTSILGNGASLAVGEGWVNEVLSFTATSSSHQIGFRSFSQVLAYQSIDGIRITESNIDHVSEAPMFGLSVFGLLLLLFIRKVS